MNLPPLNWDALRDDLALGSCPLGPLDIDRVVDEVGARAILSLQHDACRAAHGIDYPALVARGRARGVTMVNVQMRDFDAPDQRRRLLLAVFRLHALLRAHRRVYVHCTAGIGRAPLTALGYFVFVEMMPPEEAIDLISGARAVVSPFWSVLRGCQLALVNSKRVEIERRALELRASQSGFSTIRSWRQAEREIVRSLFTGAAADEQALANLIA
jgi:predicted protein tyrosine phosphatase